MSTPFPARAIVRAKINASVIGQNFTAVASGATPKIYRGAGVDFWFFFVDDAGSPINTSSISDLSILARGNHYVNR
jgi:hypothetical protein